MMAGIDHGVKTVWIFELRLEIPVPLGKIILHDFLLPDSSGQSVRMKQRSLHKCRWRGQSGPPLWLEIPWVPACLPSVG